MQKRFRLQASTSFQSIRREGRSYSHPYLVIAVLPNGLEHSRFGFVVGRRIGKAVKRNRIKRWMREAVRLRIKGSEIAAGWDVVLIARNLVAEASYLQVDRAIGLLLRQAGLMSETQ
jgi:ribonuclease P protein component